MLCQSCIANRFVQAIKKRHFFSILFFFFFLVAEGLRQNVEYGELKANSAVRKTELGEISWP